MLINASSCAIVVGGASGMGAATVKRLRALEARVAILDRDIDRGAALARETGCTFVEVDITDETSVINAFARARSTIGPERILVHTPGGGGAGHSVLRDRAGTIVRHSFERFERIVRLNLNACFLCASVSAAGMMALDPTRDGGRGVILLTSSVASQDAQPGVAAYVAAKAGVNALTVAMARELAPEMIRINAILPGTFDSPLIADLPGEYKEILLAATGHPKRFGDTDEYGSLALEIIRNEYLNGALVRLDGVARYSALARGNVDMTQKLLSHIRVLDLSRILAGPLAGQMLGDLGAEVIKIERPRVGDDARRMGPPFLKDTEGNDTAETPILIGANRNKKSVTVNIATPDGQDIIRRLAAVSDVVIENYKVGDLQRYGLGFDSLRTLNPRLIYCSVTGFGQTGPYASRPGYDSIFQAMGGLMSVTGYPDDEGGAPVKTGPSLADFVGSQFAVIGVLAALYERDANATGKGQQIDIALLDCMIASLSHYTAQYLATGVLPVRRGTQGNGGLPSQAFPCMDGRVVVVCGNDEQFRRFCAALNRRELADDSRFVHNPDRVRNRKLLTQTFDDIAKTWRQDDLLEALHLHGVPASPVNDLQQVFADPQVQFRNVAFDVPHPLSGSIKMAANPINFSDTPISTYTAPPLLGQHTAEVLTGLLGLDAAQIEALRAAQIV